MENELSQKAIDPSATMESLQTLQQSKKDLQMRFNVIKEQHDTMEAEQKVQFQTQTGLQSIEDPKQKVIAAKAELVRATIAVVLYHKKHEQLLVIRTQQVEKNSPKHNDE